MLLHHWYNLGHRYDSVANAYFNGGNEMTCSCCKGVTKEEVLKMLKITNCKKLYDQNVFLQVVKECAQDIYPGSFVFKPCKMITCEYCRKSES